ncbi:hypothetical protein [Rothia mucilaginosa]|jgi:hypothetical protein|uniref:Uncharacterized protein n=1 Tax=Rothia mucilaginosa TaxID=43675 RepID=A0A930PVD7_9MICC|nr:hypothetical protein [Rothia mucilaginosa]MBF1663982.1 hypothetical protein [Rothia mucilaginosa]DAK37408.1 MAG TPA: hypothetical protein [Caudoviricetes sp.]
MASHKIAIEFVHGTATGEKDIIHTHAYWDGRHGEKARNKAVIDAVATAIAPRACSTFDVHPGGDVYLYTGGYPRRTMLWATYTLLN